MAGVTDLLIRVTADVSGALSELQKLGPALGGAVGGNRGAIGTAAGAATGIAVTSELIANQYQDAMARIKAATSDGSENFDDLRTKLEDIAKSTNTSFDQVANGAEVWTRFFGSAGDGAVKATQAVSEFNKVSRDMTDATSTSQTVARFDRIFNSQDPSGTLNALAALGKMHTQGEQTVMDTAQMLAPTAQMMGMSQAQVLGTSNYLVEEGVGGQFAGTAIGRMLLNMGKAVSTASSAEDDPEAFSAKQQAASDRIADMNMSLQEAQERKAEMYDSRGRLKRQYIRHPSEVTSIDNQISRLQRNIGQQQGALSQSNDPLKAVRGMASLAGEDEQDFIDQFQSDPFSALQAVAQNLHGKSATQVSSLLSGAGFKNQRDIRTLAALGVDPSLMNSMIGTADQQLTSQTALDARYATVRDTRSQDIGSTRVGATSAAANAAEAADKAVGQSGLFDAIKGVADAFNTLPDPIKTTSELLAIMSGPSILKGIIGLFAGSAGATVAGGASAAVAGSGAAASVAGPASILGSTAAVGALLAAGVLAGKGLQALGVPAITQGETHPPTGSPPASPISVNIGDIQVNGTSLQQVLDAVTQHITAAWNQATNTPSPQLGGAR